MRVVRFGLLLICCLVVPSLGRDSPVWWNLSVEPSDALVSHLAGGRSPVMLGRADSPLARKSSGSLQFERKGWQTLEISVQEISEDRPIRLQPAPGMAARAARALYHLVRLSPFLLVTLGAAAGLGFLRVRRRDRARQAEALELEQRVDNRITNRGAWSGRTLGSWTLLDEIGSGGMSTVYKAVPSHTPQAAPVAMKIARVAGIESERSVRKRWIRESEVLRRTRHPNIIDIIDTGETDDTIYLVMEFLQGRTLKQALEESGRFDSARALEIALDVASALAHAHALGVTHRDLKPDNVFYTHEGEVKLLDFGLSRADDLTVATATGLVMGTPSYMAPEVSRGVVDPLGDQYAFGVMLYELLAGRLPFTETDATKLMLMHLTHKPPPIRGLLPGLQPELESIVMKMLSKKPEQRFRGMEDVLRELKAVVS